MMIAHCQPFAGETHFFAPASDFLLNTILKARPVSVRLPVIRVPKNTGRKYSESELASAAIMLEKLRKQRKPLAAEQDEAAVRARVLDVVVEKLLAKME